MFFVASKLLGFFAVPSNDMLAAGLIGLFLIPTRFVRTGRRLVSASIILFLAFGLLPLSKMLIAPLEERFPPWDASGGAPDGIVVLGGAIEAAIAPVRRASELNEAAERITVIAELARKYQSARILYSGGNAGRPRRGRGGAQMAAALFESCGVPARRPMPEEESRTTAENAAFSRRLVMPKPGERWLLVTSACHMPRSIGAFRRAGFAVEAYPVDSRATGPADRWMPFDSTATGLRPTDIAAPEGTGLRPTCIAGRRSR